MGVSSASSYSITLWSKHWMVPHTHLSARQHKKVQKSAGFYFLNLSAPVWSTHDWTHLFALAPWPAQTLENVHSHLACVLTGPGARPSSPLCPPSLSACRRLNRPWCGCEVTPPWQQRRECSWTGRPLPQHSPPPRRTGLAWSVMSPSVT